MASEESKLKIESDLVLCDMVVADRWEAIDQLSVLLLAKGYVTDEYPAKAKEREVGFPTALPTTPYAVAIPHTWAEFCLEPAVAVGTLAKPVPWIEMGTKDREQQVQIILLLSITKPEEQVHFLRKVIDFCMKPENQEKLISSDGVESITTALQEGLTSDEE